MPAPFDDARLRKLLLAFPSKAIKLLYDLHYSKLCSVAFHFTQDDKAAEDIAQETFVHVWENHKILGQSHEKSIEFYLYRVLKNKAITHYYKQKRKTKWPAWMQPAEESNSIEQEIIRQDTIQEIRRLIATFPRREKECLLLKIDQELSTKEIADQLNVTPKAVQRSLTSAGKRLRKYGGSQK